MPFCEDFGGVCVSCEGCNEEEVGGSGNGSHIALSDFQAAPLTIAARVITLS